MIEQNSEPDSEPDPELESDSESDSDSVPEPDSEPNTGSDSDENKARIEEALRRYRATLRNEAAGEHQGFTQDDYRAQKPPHW